MDGALAGQDLGHNVRIQIVDVSIRNRLQIPFRLGLVFLQPVDLVWL